MKFDIWNFERAKEKEKKMGGRCDCDTTRLTTRARRESERKAALSNYVGKGRDERRIKGEPRRITAARGCFKPPVNGECGLTFKKWTAGRTVAVGPLLRRDKKGGRESRNRSGLET